MSEVAFYSLVEDSPSKAVAERLFDHVNALNGTNFVFNPGFPNITGGFGAIKKRFPALIKMASNELPVFVITDLDTGKCAPALLQDWSKAKRASALKLPSHLVAPKTDRQHWPGVQPPIV